MRLGADDLAAVAQLLREAARREVMPRFRRLAEGDVRAKSGPLDLVTEADEAAERRIAAGLAVRFPGALIVGEEAAAAEPALLARMAAAPLAFVVDPVDGTANFAAGLPLFGLMAAAIVNGETVAGWIHDPIGDDTLLAARGEGAWLLGAAGERRACRVAPSVPLAQMVGAVSWSYMPAARKSLVLSRLPRLGASVNFRCAAHEYRLAATGGAHLLIYHRLMPWDHAAGQLIHAEAGGASAQFDGSAYSPLRHQGGLVCATDPASLSLVRRELLGMASP